MLLPQILKNKVTYISRDIVKAACVTSDEVFGDVPLQDLDFVKDSCPASRSRYCQRMMSHLQIQILPKNDVPSPDPDFAKE